MPANMCSNEAGVDSLSVKITTTDENTLTPSICGNCVQAAARYTTPSAQLDSNAVSATYTTLAYVRSIVTYSKHSSTFHQI